MNTLDDERVESRSLPVSPASPAEVRGAGWALDDLWLPAVVCDAAALEHNLDRFARWCTEHGVDHAPHGKTTMAPRLWAAQLQRGAWAITAATVAQARTMRRYDVPRVLLANEVTDPSQLRWVAETTLDPDFELYCLVDSPAVLEAVRTALERVEGSQQLPVLVELGVPGRRTGVRGVDAARELAESVAVDPRLRLAGVEGYEGVLPMRRDQEALADARGWLRQLAGLVSVCDRLGLFAESAEIIVSAGGSALVDVVTEVFAELPQSSRTVRRVVRSGCYVTHDHLSYERS
ncbi:MAG: alanine racemase, partial [Nocardioidaceae bacterium]